jgi:hypothetical protein
MIQQMIQHIDEKSLLVCVYVCVFVNVCPQLETGVDDRRERDKFTEIASCYVKTRR